MEPNPVKQHPIFKNKLHILESLGEGHTSKVYLCQSMNDKKDLTALKLLKDDFLQSDAENIKSVEQEIEILKGLKHKNIIGIRGYGTDGHIVKPSGREIKDLVFLELECIQGGLFFDVCQSLGGMGEDGGRFFMHQMLDTLGYMHGKKVVHRDLKLENILIDEEMNLKVADFGFATFRNIHKLTSYRGTKTYMAPELKIGKEYDGMQIDIFSTGVILFIIVQGNFPFMEAKKEDKYYKMILDGQLEQYWKKTGADKLSADFKDMMMKIFSFNGNDRPTVEQLKNHPWMKVPCNMENVRNDLMSQLASKRDAQSNSTKDTDGISKRGEPMLDLIRETGFVQTRMFNDMTEFDIQCTPGDLFEDFNQFAAENEIKMNVDINHDKPLKKYMKITIPVGEKIAIPAIEEQNDENDTTEKIDVTEEIVIKVKFYKVEDKVKVRVCKKQGDMYQWYSVFSKMIGTVPNPNQNGCFLIPAETPVMLTQNA